MKRGDRWEKYDRDNYKAYYVNCYQIVLVHNKHHVYDKHKHYISKRLIDRDYDFLYDYCHNPYGPAINGFYYLNGVEMTKEEWKIARIPYIELEKIYGGEEL